MNQGDLLTRAKLRLYGAEREFEPLSRDLEEITTQ